MSSANGERPLANNESQIQCPGCQSILTVPLPLNLPTNELQFSAIVIPHVDPIVCECGKLFMPRIAAWQIQLQWIEVSRESLPGVIVRPQGRLVM